MDVHVEEVKRSGMQAGLKSQISPCATREKQKLTLTEKKLPFLDAKRKKNEGGGGGEANKTSNN